MKKLLAVLLLVASTAQAENVILPDGCYVAFSNPGYCWHGGNGNTLVWVQSTDQTMLANRYGPAVAAIAAKGWKDSAALNICTEDYK